MPRKGERETETDEPDLLHRVADAVDDVFVAPSDGTDEGEDEHGAQDVPEHLQSVVPDDQLAGADLTGPPEGEETGDDPFGGLTGQVGRGVDVGGQDFTNVWDQAAEADEGSDPGYGKGMIAADGDGLSSPMSYTIDPSTGEASGGGVATPGFDPGTIPVIGDGLAGATGAAGGAASSYYDRVSEAADSDPTTNTGSGSDSGGSGGGGYQDDDEEEDDGLIISEQDNADGSHTTVHNDGTMHTTWPDGKEEWNYPDGTVETNHPDGTLVTEYPDGSTETIHPDGTTTTTPPTDPPPEETTDEEEDPEEDEEDEEEEEPEEPEDKEEGGEGGETPSTSSTPGEDYVDPETAARLRQQLIDSNPEMFEAYQAGRNNPGNVDPVEDDGTAPIGAATGPIPDLKGDLLTGPGGDTRLDGVPLGGRDGGDLPEGGLPDSGDIDWGPDATSQPNGLGPSERDTSHDIEPSADDHGGNGQEEDAEDGLDAPLTPVIDEDTAALREAAAERFEYDFTEPAEPADTGLADPLFEPEPIVQPDFPEPEFEPVTLDDGEFSDFAE
jgi:hypothetical protein